MCLYICTYIYIYIYITYRQKILRQVPSNMTEKDHLLSVLINFFLSDIIKYV